MSASEKLKALDVKPELISISAHPDLAAMDLVDAQVYARLFNALPQIVAVVEAAQREHPQPHNYWAIDADMNEIEVCPTCAALSALDEALGGVT